MTEPRTTAGRRARNYIAELRELNYAQRSRLSDFVYDIEAEAALTEVADFVEWAKQIEDFPVPFIRTAKDDAYRTISITDLSILRDYAKRLAAHAAPEEK